MTEPLDTPTEGYTPALAPHVAPHSAETLPPEDRRESTTTDVALTNEVLEQEESMLERMGGWTGLIYSTLPAMVFVPVNAWKGLQPALWGALGIALLIFLVRLLSKEKLTPAVSGFFAVALCAYIAHRMGDAKGYFVWGIWVSASYAVISLFSIVVRWPIVGVVWNALNGRGQGWRVHRGARRWYDVATLAWAVVFAARFVVQQWLYTQDADTALGVTRILMGWPLTILAGILTVWTVRRATALLQTHTMGGEQTTAAN